MLLCYLFAKPLHFSSLCYITIVMEGNFAQGRSALPSMHLHFEPPCQTSEGSRGTKSHLVDACVGLICLQKLIGYMC